MKYDREEGEDIDDTIASYRAQRAAARADAHASMDSTMDSLLAERCKKWANIPDDQTAEFEGPDGVKVGMTVREIRGLFHVALEFQRAEAHRRIDDAFDVVECEQALQVEVIRREVTGEVLH